MMISQGMVYGKQLDELVWRTRERWCIFGFITGSLFTSLMWAIFLSI